MTVNPSSSTDGMKKKAELRLDIAAFTARELLEFKDVLRNMF